MKIAVVIITVDRVLGNNYLNTTLESLRVSGVCDDPRYSIDIYHSGPNRANIDLEKIKQCKAKLHTNDSLTHTNRSTSNALKIGATREPDFVLFMEDDVSVCSRFPEFVCSQLELNSSARIIDFASYYVQVKDAYFEGERFIELNADEFYGAQCFALPPASAISFSHFIERNIDIKSGYVDTWVGDWLEDIGEIEVVTTSVPCAAQHIGLQSNFSHQHFSTLAFKDDLECARIDCLYDFSLMETGDGEFVLSHRNSLAQIELNPMAQLIYLSCLSKRSIVEIEDEIVENTGFDRFDVNQQIRLCLASLVKLGAVQYST